MGLLAFLWFYVSTSFLCSIKPVRKITLHWLPFVPVLKGLIAGGLVFSVALITVALAGLKMPTTADYAAVASLFAFAGLVKYWLPIGWFVVRSDGYKVKISLI